MQEINILVTKYFKTRMMCKPCFLGSGYLILVALTATLMLKTASINKICL